MKGEIVEPGDAGYDDARLIWNGMIDKWPRLIARCRDTEDVLSAITYARSRGLPIAVKGGGHHVAGSALNDGGLVIDVSPMRGVEFDASSEVARAQGGALLKHVDRATLPHGRAVPMGVFSDTGIAGLTLAGGYGWQSRLCGLTCDSVIAADVVTADGKVIRASAKEHSDLFWALRGGGTNLGVVTSFLYRTHPIPPEIFLVFVAYPLAEARQVISGLRDYMAAAPPECGLIAVIWTFAPAHPFPERLWGRQFVGIVGAYIGSAREGRRVVEPVLELGTKLFDRSRPAPFAELQTFFDEDYPKGRRYHWRSLYLAELGENAIDAVIDLGSRRPSPLSSLDLWMLGGAIGAVDGGETPLAHRGAPYMLGIEANWLDPADDTENVAWAREVQTELMAYSTGGSYLNFEDPTDQKRVRAVYGLNFERLQRIKATYDPSGLFMQR